jgi:hypothetical protein
MVELLEPAGMSECKPCLTPVDTNPKVASADGAPVTDASDFRCLVGALQWLTFTRPDIAYIVQQVCLDMHAPGSHILLHLRGFFDTFVAPLTLASCCDHLQRLILWSILMLIGWIAQVHLGL